MIDPTYHADVDEGFDAGDPPDTEVDWDAVTRLQAVLDDVNDPNTPTDALDALSALYGDDLQVP